MKDIFTTLYTQLTKCVQHRDYFILPKFEDVTVIEQKIPTKGAELYHKCTIIKRDDEQIVVHDVSKDNCRTFQMNPDKNIVTIEHYNGEKLVSKNEFTWEDRI